MLDNLNILIIAHPMHSAIVLISNFGSVFCLQYFMMFSTSATNSVTRSISIASKTSGNKIINYNNAFQF